MVKTPKTRHSKSSRDPVTIDLDADQVSRIGKDEPAGTEAVSETVPPSPTLAETVEAAQAGEAVTEAPSGPAAKSHARDYSFAEEPAPSSAPESSAEADGPPARPVRAPCSMPAYSALRAAEAQIRPAAARLRNCRRRFPISPRLAAMTVPHSGSKAFPRNSASSEASWLP